MKRFSYLYLVTCFESMVNTIAVVILKNLTEYERISFWSKETAGGLPYFRVLLFVVVAVRSIRVHVEHVWAYLVHLMILDKSGIADFADQLLTIDTDCLEEEKDVLIKRAVHSFLFGWRVWLFYYSRITITYHMSK